MTTSRPIIDRIVEHYAASLGRSLSLQPVDIDELRQEGQLAALEALAGSVKPTDGMTTFLSPYIQGAMLAWLRKQGRRGMTGTLPIPEFVELLADTDEKEELVAEEIPAIDTTIISEETLDNALCALSVPDSKLLIDHYGLYGRKPLTIRALAAKKGVTFMVMHGRIAAALRKLNKALQVMGVDTHAI